MVNKTQSIVVAGILIIAGLIAGAIWHYSGAPDHPHASPAERKVLYWYDPMQPETRFDKPGRSPFMDMDLIPKYADEQGVEQGSAVHIDPVQVQNLGIKTAVVREGQLAYSRRLAASVSFNQYQFFNVQARAAGFIEKVWPLTVGDKVSKGAPLIEITLPEWVEAQSEYLLLAESGAPANQLKGVLERLRLAGMPETDIQRLRTSRTLQTRFTLRAPADGVITLFELRSGMNISKEQVVAQIQGIDPVWVTAAVPESMAGLVQDKSRFEVSVAAYPDRQFRIAKSELLPSVDQSTRTLQLRLQVANPQQLLKPGMNAWLKLSTRGQRMLLIPSQAVIDSGNEQRVITVASDGRFVPKIIKVLHESENQAAIASGLKAGESVVVGGLFLIDSEANISGALERMRKGS